jgi:hypothetical protein
MSTPRFLAISGFPTATFAVTILGGFAVPLKKATFDEIYVQRFNIVEPDGTLRMVLSDKSKAAGLIINGKEYPHEERKTAGILFFNDEGTENGGLIFGGMKDKNGRVESWGHMSFDQYEQDLTLPRSGRLGSLKNVRRKFTQSPCSTVVLNDSSIRLGRPISAPRGFSKP